MIDKIHDSLSGQPSDLKRHACNLSDIIDVNLKLLPIELIGLSAICMFSVHTSPEIICTADSGLAQLLANRVA